MPIVVPCPACGTRLSAPDSAAGKHVRCPKPGCGAVAEVPDLIPAEEVPVVDATVTPPRPRRVEAVEDDEDDRPAPRRTRRRDDEFDRPRRRRKKSGTGAGAIVAVVLGGLVVLGGVGYGIYALVSKSSDTAGGGSGGGRGKAPVPAGWVEHTSVGDKFKAYFPRTPETLNLGGAVAGVKSVNVHMLNEKTGGRRVAGIIAITFGPGVTADIRDRAMAGFRDFLGKKKGGTRASEPRAVTWGGRNAQEITLEDVSRAGTKSVGQQGVVIRYMTTDTIAYVGIIGTEATGRMTQEEENGFFDNFELIK